MLGGRTVTKTGNDLFTAAIGLDAAVAPRFLVACGTQDALLPGSRRMATHLESLGLDVTASFSPGAHEWSYWDAGIQDVLAWLPVL